jgi:hypothetical protein
MNDPMKRREFMKHGALAGAAAAAAVTGARPGAAGEAGKPKGPGEGLTLPSIKLGSLTVSRLILGSNPFWGYSHKSKALDEEMKTWYTDERIIAVLNRAADAGVTAIASPPEQRWIDLFTKYREGGGRLKIWIAQCHSAADMIEAEIDRAVKAGAAAVFIQGARTEEQFGKGNFDALRRWLDRIKNAGLPAGFAAHWPEIHPELEKRKFPSDFYFQCCYCVSKGDTYRPEEREAAMKTILSIEKPVVAYKILAAGRLPPEEGFDYALTRLRPKDGVCVGVYAKQAEEQVNANAALTVMYPPKK